MAAVAESCREFNEAPVLETIRDHFAALPCPVSSTLRVHLSKDDVDADVDYLQQQRAKQPRLGSVSVSIGVPSRSAAMPSKVSNNAAAARKSSQEASISVGCVTSRSDAISSRDGPATVCLLADSRHPADPSASSAATQAPPQLADTRTSDSTAQQRGFRKRCGPQSSEPALKGISCGLRCICKLARSLRYP